mmetsp:Transcript_34581/g.81923  ORF Transcript_34581/g.81923 Transcript_34581/m.81923 type:complete len:218 (+) Transcript_34581:161-814(+)
MTSGGFQLKPPVKSCHALPTAAGTVKARLAAFSAFSFPVSSTSSSSHQKVWSIKSRLLLLNFSRVTFMCRKFDPGFSKSVWDAPWCPLVATPRGFQPSAGRRGEKGRGPPDSVIARRWDRQSGGSMWCTSSGSYPSRDIRTLCRLTGALAGRAHVGTSWSASSCEPHSDLAVIPRKVWSSTCTIPSHTSHTWTPLGTACMQCGHRFHIVAETLGSSG